MKAKKIIKNWIPPAIYRLLFFLRKDRIKFTGNYLSWDEASAQCSGYESQDILDKVLESTLKVKNGEAVFERDSVLFYEPEYVWPVLSGLLWVAAQNKGRLSVLDFGGALGSTYFQHKNFLNHLESVQWNIIEQPHYVYAGRQHLEDEQLRFYFNIEECILKRHIDVVLLSSVLQYLPDYKKIIKQSKAINSQLIIIDKTIINHNADNIYIQKNPSSIYNSIYPCRSIFKENLFSLLNDSYRLLESFDSIFFPELNQIKSSFEGYIFIRKPSI